MKKIKFCSAIAAFFMLALAGCDLEIPESIKAPYAEADYTVETLPFINEGYVPQDAVLEPLNGAKLSGGEEWDVEEDGLSISFFLSGYTSDWSMIFQVPSSNFGTTTAHICNNKTWAANSYGNADGNGSWDQFNNNDCYVTISFDYDAGTMTYYKNGEKVTVYGGDTSPYGFASWGSDTVTGKAWVQGIMDDIADFGIYCMHPTDTWANGNAGDYKMKYFVVDVAVDDDGANTKYENYKTYIAE